MDFRIANSEDVELLGDWNQQLIQDEGHRNPMTISQLRERMREWIRDEYKAAIFSVDGEQVAYALYKETASDIYLRQFFVRRDNRGQGVGRNAFLLLRASIWPQDKRLTVDVLAGNMPAIKFWQSLGFKDYCLTLEIMP